MAKANNRIERLAHLEWVPLGKTRISPLAQGDLRQYRVDYLLAHMDLEDLGNLTGNWRDEWFYVIDGQHRRAALIEWLGDGWESQQVQCWAYHNLTEAEEAEKFLKLNDAPTKRPYEKFRIGLTAKRPIPTDIERLVVANGQTISEHRNVGIGAVGTLTKVYTRSDPATFARTIRIIDQAWGTPGFEAPVIDGIGLLCQRFNGQLDDAGAIAALSDTHRGVKGLISAAYLKKEKLDKPLNQCIAAAAVDQYNKGRRSGKLANWFSA